MPRTKAPKDASKPKGRTSAYFFFMRSSREELNRKHPDGNINSIEFTKKCSERWKTMTELEKKRFHLLAAEDKKRYQIEMQGYVPPEGEKVRGKKKRIKDPNAPKRNLSGFFLFCNDERPKIKGVNPDYGVATVAKELGRLWAAVDQEVKNKYNGMAARDKERYMKEMDAYQQRLREADEEQEVQQDDEEEEEEEDEDEDE